MIHDEVDLILPSEAVLCPTMNATSLGKLMKLIETRLGERPFPIPSEQSVISEQWLKYSITGVSNLRTKSGLNPFPTSNLKLICQNTLLRLLVMVRF